MFKKITVLLSVIVTSLTLAVSAVGAASDITEIKSALEGIDIILPEMLPKITKDDYVNALSKLLYEDASVIGNPEKIARMTGMIETVEQYDGKDSMPLNEALKYAVVTLGYKSSAANTGGYVSMASSLGLTDGIDTKYIGGINADIAARIVYNMLEVEPMVTYTTAEGYKYSEIRDDETLLSLNRDTYLIEGILTASYHTSVYGESSSLAECIAIDDTYYLSEKDYSEFLGMNVQAYVKETAPGEYEVIYVGANSRKNSELVINADDIESVDKKFTNIRYYSGNKEKNVYLADVPKVIYNGKYYAGYTASDLMPKIGSLRLVDNNRDNKYDIVFVEAYQTMVVGSVADGEIYNKYSFDNSLRILDIGTNSDISDLKIYKNNAEISVEEIKVNDILSVAVSKGESEQIIKIYVCNNTVSGMIEKVNYDENEITVDGKVYPMSQDFMDFAADTAYDLSLGNAHQFFTDIFGNIAYAKKTGVMEYSFIYKSTTDDNEGYYITYLDLDNKWNTAKAARKLTVDDSVYEGEDVFEPLKKLAAQVVKIKFNSAGEVMKIETATETNEFIENEYTVTRLTSYTYRAGPKTFANKIYLNNGAKAFIICDDASFMENIEARDAGTYFGGDTSYTIRAYDIDEFGFTDLVSVERSVQSMIQPGFVVVTKVMETVNSDGEVVTAIAGNAGKLNAILAGKNADTFDGIGAGDIIRIGVGNAGTVETASKIFGLKEEFITNIPGDLYNTKTAIVSGTIEKLDDEMTRVKIDCGSKGDVSLRLSSTLSVTMFDIESNECEIITSGQLREGDKVVCRMAWGQIAEMVVLREEGSK